jgi:hypothetical protein
VVDSGFSIVKNQLARRILLAVPTATLFSLFIFADAEPSKAQGQALEDAVERLGRRAIALPHEHRVAMVWTNHAAISEQHAQHLRELFVAQLEAAQMRLALGEAAPALRVLIEQTPSRIVFSASVSTEGSVNVVIEEVARSLAGIDARPSNVVRLEKELLWRQEGKILSAVIRARSNGAGKSLLLLNEEELQVFGQEQGSWKLLATKAIPGAKLPVRTARGQIVVAEDSGERVGILFPGKRCDATLADESAVSCGGGAADWPAGRLLALPTCGTQTWWLKSDGTDWTSDDRLLLRNSGVAKDSAVAAELNVPGPVISIGAGVDAGAATVVVRNVATGDFEVYRVVLACAN